MPSRVSWRLGRTLRIPALSCSITTASAAFASQGVALPAERQWMPAYARDVSEWWESFFSGLWERAQLRMWTDDDNRAVADKVEQVFNYP